MVLHLANKELDLKNAERGTVERLEGSLATIRWGRGDRIQEVDLSRYKTWDHGYAETVYSAQSKTYARVYVLAPLGSGLVNGQNYYTAITRARFGVKLWTEDPAKLAEKLTANSGEKTSALEGLGRIERDGRHGFSGRHGDRLAAARAAQDRQRQELRDLQLLRALDQQPVREGIAEKLAGRAQGIAFAIDRFLQRVVDAERRWSGQSPVPEHSHDARPDSRHSQGPER